VPNRDRGKGRAMQGAQRRTERETFSRIETIVTSKTRDIILLPDGEWETGGGRSEGGLVRKRKFSHSSEHPRGPFKKEEESSSDINSSKDTIKEKQVQGENGRTWRTMVGLYKGGEGIQGGVSNFGTNFCECWCLPPAEEPGDN